MAFFAEVTSLHQKNQGFVPCLVQRPVLKGHLVIGICVKMLAMEQELYWTSMLPPMSLVVSLTLSPAMTAPRILMVSRHHR